MSECEREREKERPVEGGGSQVNCSRALLHAHTQMHIRTCTQTHSPARARTDTYTCAQCQREKIGERGPAMKGASGRAGGQAGQLLDDEALFDVDVVCMYLPPLDSTPLTPQQHLHCLCA